MRRFLVLLAAHACLCAISCAQDSPPAAPPSLGDYARQVRLKRQQREAQLKQASAKDTPDHSAPAADAPPSKAAHLVTNDDVPDHATVAPAVAHHETSADSPAGPTDHEAQAENWKSQIQAQKSAIASLQQEITSLGNSIHYAGGNCIANCAQWNERQQQKQQEVETMKSQLEEQQKRLEEMQEAARKQGFGSSVYDP